MIYDIERGKTLHLLKQKSKPVVTGRTKKKYNILGTLNDFKQAIDSKKKSNLSDIKEEPI